MKFIKIFERKDTIGFMCTDTIELTRVVNTELTDEQFEELSDYFEDYFEAVNKQYVPSPVLIEGIKSMEIINYHELLENSPLPDGTIILTKEFDNGGRYVIVMGEKSNTEVIMGLSI